MSWWVGPHLLPLPNVAPLARTRSPQAHTPPLQRVPEGQGQLARLGLLALIAAMGGQQRAHGAHRLAERGRVRGNDSDDGVVRDRGAHLLRVSHLLGLGDLQRRRV